MADLLTILVGLVGGLTLEVVNYSIITLEVVKILNYSISNILAIIALHKIQSKTLN